MQARLDLSYWTLRCSFVSVYATSLADTIIDLRYIGYVRIALLSSPLALFCYLNTSLTEDRAGLSFFLFLVYSFCVWFCASARPLCTRVWLPSVIVAHPVLIILYNCCPCVRVTCRFVHPRQVILPEGVARGNISCRGWTNRHVTLTQGQQLFYYTDLFHYFFQSVEKLKLHRFICSHIYNGCFR